mmetsp:Transcript_89400/g.148591  ORF Transcript_89400/g.148591 Transcript_89400/m.148591 type:complete len:206 (+) Transcript_89400:487-1104(+)
MQWIIDLNLVDSLRRNDVKPATNKANDDSCPWLYQTAGSSDRDKASQHTVQERVNVQMAEDDQPGQQSADASQTSAQRCCDRNSGSDVRRAAGRCQCGSAVEAVPAKPQDECAEAAQGTIVWAENFLTGLLLVQVLTLGTVTSLPGSKDSSTHQRRHSSRQVDDTTSSEVQHTVSAQAANWGCVEGAEPAVDRPDPVHNNWIDHC